MNATSYPSMNIDLTLLTEEQIWGDKALQVIQEYGEQTGISDLAVLLGGFVGNSLTSDHQRAGYIWSASCVKNGQVCTVRRDGGKDYYSPQERIGSVRPVVPLSETSTPMQAQATYTRKIGNVQVVEYGEYPQTLAPENVALEVAFSKGKLQTTGKTYTFDSEALNAGNKPFKAKEYTEYKYSGKRYIRVVARSSDYEAFLSNGIIPKAGDPYWIEVQPIEWLKDESGVMVARQALFAGVQFDCNKTYDGNFGITDMKYYLDTYFSKEMQVGRALNSPATVINPNTMILSEERVAQRERALNDSSQGL